MAEIMRIENERTDDEEANNSSAIFRYLVITHDEATNNLVILGGYDELGPEEDINTACGFIKRYCEDHSEDPDKLWVYEQY